MIDTDGHLAQCEHARDCAEQEFERAYDIGVRNQADWLRRNRAEIEHLLSDYASDVKDGIDDDDVADDVYTALDHPFDLSALRDLGMRIGG